MIEELMISIKKSGFRFFLMTVLFTIVFFLLNFILLETENVQAADEGLRAVYDGKEYFFVCKNFDKEDDSIFYYSPDRLNDLKKVHAELINQSFFEYYLQIKQALELVEFEGNKSFIANYKEGSEDNSFDMFGQTYFRAKAYYVSQSIIEKFALQASSGRIFEADDYIYNNDYVPVMAGHNYTGIFSVGDTFQGFCWNKSVDFKIIGFLEENASMLSFLKGDIEYLDNYILVPGLEFKEEPANLPDEVSQTMDERLMQETACSSYLNFIITLPEGYELNDFIAYYDGLRSKYNIPEYYLANINLFAIKMLQLSHTEYYDRMLFLVFSLAIFSFICMCVFLVLNSLRRLNTYYVHLLLGAGYFKIYVMILSEGLFIIALCHLLSFGISKIMIGRYHFLFAAASFLVFAFAPVPAMMVVKKLSEKDFLWRKE